MATTTTVKGRPTDQYSRPDSTTQDNIQRMSRDYTKGVDPVFGTVLGAFGLNKKRRSPPDYLWRNKNSGFNDLLTNMEQGGSASNAIQDLITNFKGSKESLADFLEIGGPLFGALEANRTEQGAAFQHMADQSNWDLGAMGAYGDAAGQIGQGTTRAISQAQQNMASRGLGRGAGQTALTALLQQQGANQQAGLRAQLQQKAAQNRMASAGNLFSAQQSIAQMALGQGITPRINSPQGSDQGIGGIGQGAAAGASMGAVAGPWGALIGGVAGAGYGAYQNKK